MNASGNPTAAARTLIRTSPGPGVGSSSPTNVNASVGAPIRSTCHARTRGDATSPSVADAGGFGPGDPKPGGLGISGHPTTTRCRVWRVDGLGCRAMETGT